MELRTIGIDLGKTVFHRIARHPGLGSMLSFTTRTCLRAARDSVSINAGTDRS